MHNPINDLTYDWITILQSKANGLNAYDKYLQDARQANADECISLLEELRRQDAEAVEKVRDHVAYMLQQNSDMSRSSQTMEDPVRVAQ